MTIPCMVIGLISLVLHVALQRPIDADPGWWVAMIIFAAWNLLLLPTWYVVVEYLDPWIQIRLLSREWRKRRRRTRRRSGK